MVIALDSINILNYFALGFRPHKYKLLYWGIGAPASYTRHYGEAGKMYYRVSDYKEKRSRLAAGALKTAERLTIDKRTESILKFISSKIIQ